MSANLQTLDADSFEHLIQALMTAQFGYRVRIYGDGPDGQREAMIECAEYEDYLQAEGKTIIQAKYKTQGGREEDWGWLQRMLRRELDAFEKKALTRPELLPDTWVFYTNIVLTAAQDSGMQDQADRYVAEKNEAFEKKHGRKLIEHVYIHGADTVRSMLDASPRVYERFFGSERVLREYLDRHLANTRKEHPSFKLMRPDELDPRLFPRIETKGRRVETDAPASVWGLIAESWEQSENHSIVIEGAGGIGKTVTLLSPTVPLPAPALYVHLYELVEENRALSLSEYLQKKMPEYAQEIGRLAMQSWEDGPSLILLLDGFNEIPGEKRWKVLGLLNEWRTAHPGAQFIAVSRPLDGLNLVEELAGRPIGITLAPLTKEDVTRFLTSRGQKLPTEETLWEILGLPLFLTLYAKTGRITQTEAAGYPLAFKPARSKGAIIWNYLQRELLRKPGDADWVLSCARALRVPPAAHRVGDGAERRV